MNIWFAISTLAGVGKIPRAPGTFGTLAFMPIVFLLSYIEQPYVYMAFTVFFIVLSVIAANKYADGKDLKEIVADEGCGILISMFLVPLNAPLWLLGFLLFRFFDIVKPYPIRLIDQRMKGGFGVVLDDIVAGLFTNMLIHFVVIKGVLAEFYLNLK